MLHWGIKIIYNLNIKTKGKIMPAVKKSKTKKPATKPVVRRKPVRRTVRPTVQFVEPRPMIDPIAAVKNFWTGYFDVTGRATRSEFWFGILFAFVLEFLCSFFFGGIVAIIARIVLIVPIITLMTRRFRDAGISVWWYLIPALLLSLPPLFDMALYYIADVASMTTGMRIYTMCFWIFIIFDFIVACIPSKR